MSILGRIFRVIFVRRAPNQYADEAALMNYALDLAQEWGEQWLEPVQRRLMDAYPNMSQTEADYLNDAAQKAMKTGHDLVYLLAENSGKNVKQLAWQEMYVKQYPWVDKKNLNHLFSTGMYYAWKDGLC
jgi:hypothetical protein